MRHVQYQVTHDTHVIKSKHVYKLFFTSKNFYESLFYKHNSGYLKPTLQQFLVTYEQQALIACWKKRTTNSSVNILLCSNLIYFAEDNSKINIEPVTRIKVESIFLLQDNYCSAPAFHFSYYTLVL